MRPRFNRVMIASSSHYSESRKTHIEMLRENHEIAITITKDVKIRKTYVRCFGNLIELSEKEVEKHSSLNIVWKEF